MAVFGRGPRRKGSLPTARLRCRCVRAFASMSRHFSAMRDLGAIAGEKRIGHSLLADAGCRAVAADEADIVAKREQLVGNLSGSGEATAASNRSAVATEQSMPGQVRHAFAQNKTPNPAIKRISDLIELM
jgi:hypothetical protein